MMKEDTVVDRRRHKIAWKGRYRCGWIQRVERRRYRDTEVDGSSGWGDGDTEIQRWRKGVIVVRRECCA